MSLILPSQMSLLLLGLLVLLSGAAANFHEGDFIPSARRAQFGGVCQCQQVHVPSESQWKTDAATYDHFGAVLPDTLMLMQSRTHWHDLLGRHCPRFGEDHVVGLPTCPPACQTLS